MEVVDIRTEMFVATVISLAEMPGEAVVAMLARDGGMQMIGVLSMFKLAQIDQSELHMARLMGLPYGEMGEVLDQWTSKSANSETRELDVSLAANWEAGFDGGDDAA